MMSGKITANVHIAPGYFLMSLALPPSFSTPLPGQFVMIHLWDQSNTLLGRPISVYAFHRSETTVLLELMYRVVGKGTLAMSRLKPDDSLQILGPLGRSFNLFPERKYIVLVAGGLGVAPLSFLAAHYQAGRSRGPETNPRLISYLGATCSEKLVGVERLQEMCNEVNLTTDDGSCGSCGLVTDLLTPDLSSYSPAESAIYACGPQAMLQCLAEIIDEQALCQVSVEERMACGVGACLGCAIAVRSPDGKPHYQRVCKEGPVFDIREIAFKRKDPQ